MQSQILCIPCWRPPFVKAWHSVSSTYALHSCYIKQQVAVHSTVPTKGCACAVCDAALQAEECETHAERLARLKQQLAPEHSKQPGRKKARKSKLQAQKQQRVSAADAEDGGTDSEQDSGDEPSPNQQQQQQRKRRGKLGRRERAEAKAKAAVAGTDGSGKQGSKKQTAGRHQGGAAQRRKERRETARAAAAGANA